MVTQIGGRAESLISVQKEFTRGKLNFDKAHRNGRLGWSLLPKNTVEGNKLPCAGASRDSLLLLKMFRLSRDARAHRNVFFSTATYCDKAQSRTEMTLRFIRNSNRIILRIC